MPDILVEIETFGSIPPAGHTISVYSVSFDYCERFVDRITHLTHKAWGRIDMKPEIFIHWSTITFGGRPNNYTCISKDMTDKFFRKLMEMVRSRGFIDSILVRPKGIILNDEKSNHATLDSKVDGHDNEDSPAPQPKYMTSETLTSNRPDRELYTLPAHRQGGKPTHQETPGLGGTPKERYVPPGPLDCFGTPVHQNFALTNSQAKEIRTLYPEQLQSPEAVESPSQFRACSRSSLNSRTISEPILAGEPPRIRGRRSNSPNIGYLVTGPPAVDFDPNRVVLPDEASMIQLQHSHPRTKSKQNTGHTSATTNSKLAKVGRGNGYVDEIFLSGAERTQAPMNLAQQAAHHSKHFSITSSSQNLKDFPMQTSVRAPSRQGLLTFPEAADSQDQNRATSSSSQSSDATQLPHPSRLGSIGWRARQAARVDENTTPQPGIHYSINQGQQRQVSNGNTDTASNNRREVFTVRPNAMMSQDARYWDGSQNTYHGTPILAPALISSSGDLRELSSATQLSRGPGPVPLNAPYYYRPPQMLCVSQPLPSSHTYRSTRAPMDNRNFDPSAYGRGEVTLWNGPAAPHPFHGSPAHNRHELTENRVNGYLHDHRDQRSRPRNRYNSQQQQHQDDEDARIAQPVISVRKASENDRNHSEHHVLPPSEGYWTQDLGRGQHLKS